MNRNTKFSAIPMMFAALILSAAVMFTAGSAQAATARPAKAVKATVKVGVTTEIAGTTLQPGKYTVKITPSSDDAGDPTVEFSEVVYNPYVEEGLSPYEPQVVLTVQSTTKDLGAPAASTGLITSEDSDKASGLEIRGNSTEYVFESASAVDNQ